MNTMVLLRWLLGAAVAGTALGLAAATFRGDGTAINAYLFLTAEFSHGEARRIERIAVALVVGLAIFAWFRPVWPALLVVGGYAFLEALARSYEGGQAYSEWALAAHAPRYLTPLAAILIWEGLRRGAAGRVWQAAGEGVLRVALATVFFIHGLEAVKAHPGFVDLVLSSTINLADWRVSQTAATRGLLVIGIIDFLVAAALLLRPHPAILFWAAFWGLVTALSRVTAYGWPYYPDLLVRAPHYLAPLVLWWLARMRTKPGTQAAPVGVSVGNPV